jgi:hypothetical protein
VTHRHLRWEDPELQAAQDRACDIFCQQEPIRLPADASATRFKSNPNWSYRGDNTKYRSTK